MSVDQLVDVTLRPHDDAWAQDARTALTNLYSGADARYPTRAEKAIKVRAPEMRGDGNVPFAALIHPENPDSGMYGGTSFVLFPVEEGPALIALVVGTQGLNPDEEILGKPGHARKAQSICRWLNHRARRVVAWAKSDPTRTDENVPSTVRETFSLYKGVFDRYGTVLYAVFAPSSDSPDETRHALNAFLDLLLEERGFQPLAKWQESYSMNRSGWLEHLLPQTSEDHVVALLKDHKYVILEGPPGTGKSRMAHLLIGDFYGGRGMSIQFHPNTTYETFVGGLAPIETTASIGFAFAPKAGPLIEASVAARECPERPYLLHIDEVNRADLAKVLGEGLYLLEPNPESPRTLQLPYRFSELNGNQFGLPANLHILGTMNSSDRSTALVDIAIRRRFAFTRLWPQLSVVEEHGSDFSKRAFEKLVQIFVEHASDQAFELLPGHSYFMDSEDSSAKTRLLATLAPLLREYVAQGHVAGFASEIRGYLQWLESSSDNGNF